MAEGVVQLVFVQREFTPAEMERITGIAPHLQRTWRKRGILPEGGWRGENREGGWTRWSLDDVVIAKVFKLAGDLGFPRKASLHIGLRLCSEIFLSLVCFDGAFSSEGTTLPPLPQGPPKKNWKTTRFFVVAHSEAAIDFFDAEDLDRRISKHQDASTIAAVMSGAEGYSIFDVEQIARDIFDRAAGPVFRLEPEGGPQDRQEDLDLLENLRNAMSRAVKQHYDGTQ